MPAPQNAPLPPFFTLTRGMQVRLVALDTDGNQLTTVILSAMALSVDQEDVDTPGKSVPLDPAFLPGSEVLV